MLAGLQDSPNKRRVNQKSFDTCRWGIDQIENISLLLNLEWVSYWWLGFTWWYIETIFPSSQPKTIKATLELKPAILIISTAINRASLILSSKRCQLVSFYVTFTPWDVPQMILPKVGGHQVVVIVVKTQGSHQWLKQHFFIFKPS